MRRLGYDPLGDAVKQDVAQNVLQHINDRVRFVWPIWDWPELNALEWRSFGIVWTSSLTISANQIVYYFGDGVVAATQPDRTIDWPTPGVHAGYYKCILNAPQGTLPTNVTYFVALSGTTALTDRYIPYAQLNENVIGDFLDAYPQNPREVRSCRIIKTQPGSKGIDVLTGLDLVWIRYRIPVSQFTLTPYLGSNYTPIGATYYDEISGDCYISQTATFNAVQGPIAQDPKVPFPFFFKGYVIPAAYADTVMETTMEAKIRLMVAQAAQNEAVEYLQREIDNLAAQGQKLFYNAFPSRRRHHVRPDISAGAIPVEVFPPGFTGQ